MGQVPVPLHQWGVVGASPYLTPPWGGNKVRVTPYARYGCRPPHPDVDGRGYPYEPSHDGA